MPEDTILVEGVSLREVYYLPNFRRSREADLYLRARFAEFGELIYECEGRGCGSSFYWANEYIREAITAGWAV